MASASWRTICPQHEQKGGRPDFSGEIVSSIVQMPLLGFTSWIRVIRDSAEIYLFSVFFCLFFFGGGRGSRWKKGWDSEMKSKAPALNMWRYILQQSLPFGKFRESSSRTETAPSSKSSPPVSCYVMVICTEFLYYGGLLVVDLTFTLSESGWCKISITASLCKPIDLFPLK